MTSPLRLEPVVLEGRSIRLEPLAAVHAQGLMEAATPELFEYLFDRPDPWTIEGFRAYVEAIPRLPARLPFAMVDIGVGRAIGTTSYFDIRSEHLGLEIGYTWIGARHQGTHVNPESKYLLLRHAFEILGCVRVQLKTDMRNLRSQRAMAKLGARREGVLRRHMVRPDGYVRDTVLFSITDEEWPEVRSTLEARLGWNG
ncbi:MAG TPA: GNAT family protein [Fimbriimonadaceae bacterium]|nr:GNAT family protein [Fimbriimonadaceae bacterium]HRJ97539.1 GNAT family protein [Fimbriimonadaceae bacterium]